MNTHIERYIKAGLCTTLLEHTIIRPFEPVLLHEHIQYDQSEYISCTRYKFSVLFLIIL